MSKKNVRANIDNDSFKDSILAEDLSSQFSVDEDARNKMRDDEYFPWSEREALLLGRNQDSGSANSKSQVNTQELVNLVLDSSCRVMAQNASGKVQALTKKDRGKSALMHYTFNNYVVPNANSQFGSMLLKDRVWNVYSKVYGGMPILVHYRTDDQYIGPDYDIISPRLLVPEKGATTVQECTRMWVDTWHSKGFIKSRLGMKSWKNIEKLLIKMKQGSPKDKASADSQERSFAENQYNPFSSGDKKGDAQQVRLRTQYLRKRWITFTPDFMDDSGQFLIVRDIANPHGNSRIPIVVKQCFPLMDRFYGLAEFERGKTLAYAMNSLVNLYLDGVKLSIFPPLMINPDEVVLPSLKYEALAKWLVNRPDAVTQLQLTPQGLNTFQSTYSFMKGALLNMGATTDTSVSASVDPGLGKTPAALQLQGAREGARDNWDRFMMENAIEERNNLMIDLIASQQDQQIDIDLFGQEVKEMMENYPDLKDWVEVSDSREYAKLSIPSKDLHGDGADKIKYRFTIDASSTMKKDEAIENQTLAAMLEPVLKLGDPKQIALEGKVIIGNKTIEVGEMIKRQFMTSGVQDADKIIHDTDPQDLEKLNQALNPPPPPPPPQPMQPPMDQMMSPQGLPPQGMPQMPQQQMPQPPMQMPQGAPQDPVAMMEQELAQLGGQVG